MGCEPGEDRAPRAVAPEVTPALWLESTLDEAGCGASPLMECLRAGRELR